MTESNNTDLNMFFDWNDTIELDGQEYVLLEDGDYDFTVTGFDRGRFPGGAKIPPCNKAALTLQVKTDRGTANVHLDLLLYRTMEWKLSAFFRCIGLKKQGERVNMDWNSLIGATGRGHFKTRTYTDRDGNEKSVNEIDRFYDKNNNTAVKKTETSHVESRLEDELPF